MANPAKKKPRITIRRTTPDDLGTVVELLRRRDDREHDASAVSGYLFGLEPEHLLGWIAFDGERPVGLTTLYVRKLRWGEKGFVTAGYWSHLYVDEDYRRVMVYPRLVLGMMKEAPAAGVELIYTGTRRPQVAEMHVKMGFRELGIISVGVKPLRPAQLIGRHRNLPVLPAVSPPIDALFGGLQRVLGNRGKTDAAIESVSPGDASVAAWLEEHRDSAGGRIGQEWTVEEFSRRFAATFEGGAYRMLIAKRAGAVAGGLLFRTAIRGNDLVLGIIMDLAVRDAEPGLTRALLRRAEDVCRADGCLAVLHLDGVPGQGETMKQAGYRHSSETYHMLIWPKEMAGEAEGFVAELANWRFPFSEHDAF
jgi:hypothetical protein